MTLELLRNSEKCHLRSASVGCHMRAKTWNCSSFIARVHVNMNVLFKEPLKYVSASHGTSQDMQEKVPHTAISTEMVASIGFWSKLKSLMAVTVMMIVNRQTTMYFNQAHHLIWGRLLKLNWHKKQDLNLSQNLIFQNFSERVHPKSFKVRF